MKKTVTIRDVASVANVSTGTVSMVLNGSGKTSENTKKRVMDVVDRMGYVPNPYARSLSLSKSYQIGFIVTDLTNPFFGMMVDHIQREVEKHNNSLLVSMTNNSITKEKSTVENYIKRGIDGIIIVPAHEQNADVSHIYKLFDKKIPTVFISSHHTGIEQNCIMTDLAAGALDLTMHLLKTGHKSITLLSGYRGLVLSEERINGFLQAHREMNIPVSKDQIIQTDPIYVGGYNAAKQVMQGTTPDAIMCVNDLVAMGVLTCLREMKLNVPSDVSVTGYDDLIYSSMLDKPLTTVRQPIKKMAIESVDLLFNLISGKEGLQKPMLLEPEVKIRESSR